MTPEIALLDASSEYENARRNFRREVDASLTEYPVSEGHVPPPEVPAAIITGSSASVYWDDHWIQTLRDWVEDAVNADTPILGVCFGHQLLADVLGGEVINRDTYELGYHTIEQTAESVLFEGIPREFVAFTSHSDDVLELPTGARELAKNQYSIQAFQLDRVFGVQFHPEVDLETARNIVDNRQPSGERTPNARETLTEENYEKAQQTKQIFDNFTAFAAQYQEE